MQHNELIHDLTKDLQPVKPMAPNWRRFLLWSLFSGLSIVLIIQKLGIRHDLQLVLHDFQIWPSWMILMLTALTSAYIALEVSIPGRKPPNFIRSLPIAGLITWLGLNLVQLVNLEAAFQAKCTLICIRNILIAAIIPGSLIYYMLRKGFPAHYRYLAFTTGVSAVGLGEIAAQLICSNSDPGHIFTAHALPTIAVVSVLVVAARKIFDRSHKFSEPV